MDGANGAPGGVPTPLTIFENTRIAGPAAAAMAANLLLLLLHKTFGGWQFGARYTVDLLPYVLWMMAKQNPQAPQKWMLLLGGFGVLFNAFGALYMLLLA